MFLVGAELEVLGVGLGALPGWFATKAKVGWPGSEKIPLGSHASNEPM